jgi:integrase
VKFFVRWHGQSGIMRHPREMAGPEIEAFLTMLAAERKVSASTHNQAMSAVLFLYREVLGIDLPWLDGINRPSQNRRIPSVLTRDEVAGVLAHMEGITALSAQLLYGTGMRLMEGMRLRIKDVDFDRHVIIVRDAKGGKDRVVMLPRSLAPALRVQMLAARSQWEADRQAQLCHTLAASWHRYSHRAGAAGAQRCEHDDDLYPCAEGGCGRHGQPAGCAAGACGMTCTTSLFAI